MTITMISNRRGLSVLHKPIDSEKRHNYRLDSFIAKQYKKDLIDAFIKMICRE